MVPCCDGWYTLVLPRKHPGAWRIHGRHYCPHQHEGIYDREPVDLEGLGQKRVLRVSRHTVRKWNVRGAPAHGVGEIELRCEHGQRIQIKGAHDSQSASPGADVGQTMAGG
eukprot:scaffold454_cov124-Isochrysis_galbana.AAC.5